MRTSLCAQSFTIDRARFVGALVLLGLIGSAGCQSSTPEPAPAPAATAEGNTPPSKQDSAKKAEDSAMTLAQRRQSLVESYLSTAKLDYDQGRLEDAYADLARVLDMDP